MTLEEIIHYRRSVRHYKNLAIDTEKVKHCIELATLAPNSSNMQLWEFYHVTNPEILKKPRRSLFKSTIGHYCPTNGRFCNKTGFTPKKERKKIEGTRNPKMYWKIAQKRNKRKELKAGKMYYGNR